MELLKHITVTEIADVLTVTAPRGRRFHMQDRKWYGLSFCTSGRITYRHGEREIVSTRDCAVILPMHATYTLYNNESGQFPLINFYCLDDLFTDEFIVIPIASIAAYQDDLEHLKQLFHTGGSRLAYLGTFYKILARLAEEESNATRLLAPAIAYMHTHLADQSITNPRLAKEANISEIYLRTLFRECYHTSPRQYLIDLRIEHTKQMLIETDETVQKIALSAGFASIYHFSRAFRARVGMTPTEYRSSCLLRSM